MEKPVMRRMGAVGSIALLLVLSGCFQTVGTSPDPLAAQIPPTWTLPPPVVEVQQVEVVVTATTDPALLDFASNLPTTDPALQGIPLPTTDPAIGGPIVSQPQDLSGQVGVPSSLSDLDMTATAIVSGATATIDAMFTQTALALFPPTAIPTATPQPVTGGTTLPLGGTDCIHEVQAGDRNLYRISLVYGVTVDEIARATGLANPNLIVVGQQLIIPGCGRTGAVPPATSIPSTDGQGGGSVAPVTGGGTTYTVQQGDTLFKISLQTGVPVASIAAANNISDWDRIFINQQLVIPAG